MQPAVYILASQRNGTLYVGVTSDLVQRIYQHREHLIEGFTSRYNVTMLVWYELHPTMESAITREKQLKKWNRAWKLQLIEENNVSCSVSVFLRFRATSKPSFPRRRESSVFGFSCFWVSGNFQIVIPTKEGIQTCRHGNLSDKTVSSILRSRFPFSRE